MGSLICFVLPALMTITVTTVAQTKQKYQAQVSETFLLVRRSYWSALYVIYVCGLSTRHRSVRRSYWSDVLTGQLCVSSICVIYVCGLSTRHRSVRRSYWSDVLTGQLCM